MTRWLSRAALPTAPAFAFAFAFGLALAPAGPASAYPEPEVELNRSLQAAAEALHAKTATSALSLSVSLPGEAGIRDFMAGSLTQGGGEAVISSTLFHIGSITKSFTSVLALQLVAEGKLGLDDSIAELAKRYPDWLPEAAVRRWGAVTLRQLLNMTSGIYDYTGDAAAMAQAATEPQKVWTLDEMVGIALAHDDIFPPGKGWYYSNTAYVMAGQLVAAAAGKPLAAVMAERLLDQDAYNLTNTHYLADGYPAPLYRRLVTGTNIDGKPLKDVNPSFFQGAGGLLSTSHDTVRWARLLLSGAILPPAQQQALLTAVSEKTGQVATDIREQAYGLGVLRFYDRAYGGPVWSYLGATIGFTAVYLAPPCLGVVVAVTVNGNEGLNHGTPKGALEGVMLEDVPKQAFGAILGSELGRERIRAWQKGAKLPDYCTPLE